MNNQPYYINSNGITDAYDLTTTQDIFYNKFLFFKFKNKDSTVRRHNVVQNHQMYFDIKIPDHTDRQIQLNGYTIS